MRRYATPVHRKKRAIRICRVVAPAGVRTARSLRSLAYVRRVVDAPRQGSQNEDKIETRLAYSSETHQQSCQRTDVLPHRLLHAGALVVAVQ